MFPSLVPTFMRHALRRLPAARGFLAEQQRQLRDDVLAVKGLMPLLMKARNGGTWTDAEREQIRICLRRLSATSPYLIVLVMPGGFVLLPVLAWWLDRRRSRRKAEAARRQAP